MSAHGQRCRKSRREWMTCTAAPRSHACALQAAQDRMFACTSKLLGKARGSSGGCAAGVRLADAGHAGTGGMAAEIEHMSFAVQTCCSSDATSFVRLLRAFEVGDADDGECGLEGFPHVVAAFDLQLASCSASDRRRRRVHVSARAQGTFGSHNRVPGLMFPA